MRCDDNPIEITFEWLAIVFVSANADCDTNGFIDFGVGTDHDHSEWDFFECLPDENINHLRAPQTVDTHSY